MPSIKFLNSPAMAFSATLTLQNLSGNRSWLLPDRSGTFVSSATSPLAIDAVSGNISVTGTFLTSLNGQTGATQTFSVGSTGTAPNISSSANNHQFNIPLAGLGVTGGLFSNAAQNIYGNKTFIDKFIATSRAYGYFAVAGTPFTPAGEAELYKLAPTAGNTVVNLSNIASEARSSYYFVRETNGVGSFTSTIVPFGTEKISGLTGIVLTKDHDFIHITNTGTTADGWVVVAGIVGGVPFTPQNTVRALIDTIVTIQPNVDTLNVTIPGFLAASGWTGSLTFVTPTFGVVPLATPYIWLHDGFVTVKSNYPYPVPVTFTFAYRKP
jgi:hypothetical protein